MSAYFIGDPRGDQSHPNSPGFNDTPGDLWRELHDALVAKLTEAGFSERFISRAEHAIECETDARYESEIASHQRDY